MPTFGDGSRYGSGARYGPAAGRKIKMSKLKRDLKESDIPRKVMRGAEILAASTPANTDLGNVTTEVADLTAANTKLEADLGKVVTAQAALTTNVGIQNESNDDWNHKYEMYLLAVEKNTKGDRDKMRTTTVETYEPGHAPALGAPAKVANVAVTNGDMPHEQEITWNGNQPRPKIYQVMMCEDPYDATKLAQVGMPTGSRFVKANQTPGKTYWFVVVAVGSGGQQGPPSDPATGMAT